MRIDHEARARRAWPLLVQRASTSKSPFTYAELCTKLGYHHRAASYFLGVIQDYCHENGRPALQAFAVNKKTGLPGRGYNGSARSYTEHDAELLRVRKKVWPKKAPF